MIPNVEVIRVLLDAKADLHALVHLPPPTPQRSDGDGRGDEAQQVMAAGAKGRECELHNREENV